MLKIHSERAKPAVYIVVVTAGVYLCIKFLLPVFFPFILAYGFALIVLPAAEWMHNKLHFQKNIAVAMVMLFYIVIIVLIGGCLLKNGFVQLKNLISNLAVIQEAVDIKVKNICDSIDMIAGLESGEVYYIVRDCIDNFVESSKSQITNSVMGNSLPIIVEIGEFIAAVVVVIVGTFFFAVEKDNITKWRETFPFAKEFNMVAGKLHHVFAAFIRAQSVIMFFTAVICTIGLWIMGNPYSIILGSVIGLLDALPLIGVGLILIPWAIFSFVSGKIKNGVIILIIFALCYITREILEPKLIGKNAGIHPIVSLISIYVGYKAFGILGVVLGPIAYAIIAEVVKEKYIY